MTTTIAPVGLTFDAVDLQLADLSLYLTLTSGLDDGFDTRGIDVTVPGLDGQWPRPRRFDHRKILLAGHVLGTGVDSLEARIAYRGLRQLIAELFASDRAPATLIAYLEDGSLAIVNAQPISIAAVERIPSEWASLSIELLAVDKWTLGFPASVSPASVPLATAVPVPTVTAL